MTAPRTLLRAAAIAVCAGALAGCISLFPKSKPAALYHLEPVMPTPAADRAVAGDFLVLRAGGFFTQAAAGDRILTLSGEQAAYVAQTRWVSPAAQLWDEALLRAFDASGGPARLVSRGEPGRPEYALRLDVRDFEAVYENGPEAAPVILVRVRAALTRNADAGPVAEQIFEARIPAADNRVSAIVAAFNQATGQVLGRIVDWTNRKGQSS